MDTQGFLFEVRVCGASCTRVLLFALTMHAAWRQHIAALHAAELIVDEPAAFAAVEALAALAVLGDVPVSWRTPFETDSFCQSELFCASPSIFWRRVAKRVPAAVDVIATLSATLTDADLFDATEPAAVSFVVGSTSLSLIEGSYATGGVGRFVYAAATALGTLIAEQVPDVPAVAGRRVLELGCGVGLVGLVAAACGASSVLMTDNSLASVECARQNAARNEVSDTVRATVLDWEAFRTDEGAKRACEAAGLERSSAPDMAPELILGADCCYSEAMGDALLAVLGYLLKTAPPGSRAVVVNGWPNRGLHRFETLVGARAMLATAECAAIACGEPRPPPRPFIEPSDGPSSGVPTVETPTSVAGLESLSLLSARRLTGFSDHAHHLYVFGARRLEPGLDPGGGLEKSHEAE